MSQRCVWYYYRASDTTSFFFEMAYSGARQSVPAHSVIIASDQGHVKYLIGGIYAGRLALGVCLSAEGAQPGPGTRYTGTCRQEGTHE